MEQTRLITVAIHTLAKAQQMRALLEREGVNVTLQNVNLSEPVMSAGVRVRISESDLPLALRIIENPEIFRTENLDAHNSDEDERQHILLVPVDFSVRSQTALKVAFPIAHEMGCKVVLLHSFLVPHTNPLTALGASLTFDSADRQIEDAETSVEIAAIARRQMRELESTLRGQIKKGELPAVKYSSVLIEGVPEECINQYIKEHSEVRMLVMGTRTAAQKAEDLAGSVTAEVLDTCQIQALTVPESSSTINSLSNIKKIALLSNLEQEDFLALDAINRMLPQNHSIAVDVICIPNNRYSKATNEAARNALREYCNDHFPSYSFTLTEQDKNLPALIEGQVDLLVVPNRKKNIFARLFNPGQAHRILFHTDVPMMVIPV